MSDNDEQQVQDQLATEELALPHQQDPSLAPHHLVQDDAGNVDAPPVETATGARIPNADEAQPRAHNGPVVSAGEPVLPQGPDATIPPAVPFNAQEVGAAEPVAAQTPVVAPQAPNVPPVVAEEPVAQHAPAVTIPPLEPHTQALNGQQVFAAEPVVAQALVVAVAAAPHQPPQAQGGEPQAAQEHVAGAHLPAPQGAVDQPVPGPALQGVAAMLFDIRNQDYYLGREQLHSQVAFLPGGRAGDRVVRLGDATREDAEPVQFRVIAKMHRHDHFLSPDGNDILRRNDTAPPNTRLRGVLQPAAHSSCQPLAGDWLKVVSNMQGIARKMNGKKGLPVRMPFNRDTQDLVFTHRIMLKKDEFDDEPLGDVADLFTVQGWPASTQWHERATTFETTHNMSPLPAYDELDNLIVPQDYERKLPGATVDATLQLVSYCINGRQNVLVLELQSLKILVPAVPLPSEAKKRRMDVLNQVTKKRRLEGG